MAYVVRTCSVNWLFVIESNHYRLARLMKRLLQEISKAVFYENYKRLKKLTYKRLQIKNRAILTKGGNELSAIPDTSNYKRTQIAK